MTFTGFPKDAMGFWHELSVEMNKPWFEANKARYEAQWVAPMRALLADVAARLAPSYRGIGIGEPRIMRIYRDVRFAKDKTPYKTHIGASLPLAGHGGKPSEGPVALYAHFGLEEEMLAVGQYGFMDAALARWRKGVAAPGGAQIAKVLAGLAADGYGFAAQDTSVRVPKPFPADHPRADLLRQKGAVVMLPAIPRGLIHKPALVEWIATRAKAAAPLSRWLHAHVA